MRRRTIHAAQVPQVEDILLQSRYALRANSSMLGALLGIPSFTGKNKHLIIPNPVENTSVYSWAGKAIPYTLDETQKKITVYNGFSIVAAMVADPVPWSSVSQDAGLHNMLFEGLQDIEFNFTSSIPSAPSSGGTNYRRVTIWADLRVVDQGDIPALPFEESLFFNPADPRNPVSIDNVSRERACVFSLDFSVSGISFNTIPDVVGPPEGNNYVPLLDLILTSAGGGKIDKIFPHPKSMTIGSRSIESYYFPIDYSLNSLTQADGTRSPYNIPYSIEPFTRGSFYLDPFSTYLVSVNATLLPYPVTLTDLGVTEVRQGSIYPIKPMLVSLGGYRNNRTYLSEYGTVLVPMSMFVNSTADTRAIRASVSASFVINTGEEGEQTDLEVRFYDGNDSGFSPYGRYTSFLFIDPFSPEAYQPFISIIKLPVSESA